VPTSSIQTQVLVAIGQIVISLRKAPLEPEEARRYIFTHSEIRNLIAWMVDEILEKKPEKPVEYIHEVFTAMQEERDAGKPKAVVPAENDDLMWL
jgi:hypothetical protein